MTESFPDWFCAQMSPVQIINSWNENWAVSTEPYNKQYTIQNRNPLDQRQLFYCIAYPTAGEQNFALISMYQGVIYALGAPVNVTVPAPSPFVVGDNSYLWTLGDGLATVRDPSWALTISGNPDPGPGSVIEMWPWTQGPTKFQGWFLPAVRSFK